MDFRLMEKITQTENECVKRGNGKIRRARIVFEGPLY
jgi:hypothetical protein